jgi:hypothetical protein
MSGIEYTTELYCAGCGKPHRETLSMIGFPTGVICDECAAVIALITARNLLKENNHAWRDKLIAHLGNVENLDLSGVPTDMKG